MSRIYTRTGDTGTTGIHGGTRVPKDDIRIEANGCLDELNCQIGIVRSMMRSRIRSGMTEEIASGMTQERSGAGDIPSNERFSARMTEYQSDAERTTEGSGFALDRCPGMTENIALNFDEVLHEVQKNLMIVMSLVATPSETRSKNPNSLPDNLVAHCEDLMDSLTEAVGPSHFFLLPGGTPLASQLQMARAICRRAERRLWTLHRQDPLPEEILKYINRLSDLLFVMARCELERQQWPEEHWQAFAYKNQK